MPFYTSIQDSVASFNISIYQWTSKETVEDGGLPHASRPVVAIIIIIIIIILTTS